MFPKKDSLMKTAHLKALRIRANSATQIKQAWPWSCLFLHGLKACTVLAGVQGCKRVRVHEAMPRDLRVTKT